MRVFDSTPPWVPLDGNRKRLSSLLQRNLPVLFPSDEAQQPKTETSRTGGLRPIIGKVVNSVPTSAHVNNKSVIETQSPFLAYVLLSHRGRVQLVDAAECEGDDCYISQELIEKNYIIPEGGRVRILWRKFDGDALTRSECEVLERSQIKGDADLILGKGRKRQEGNDCKNVEEVIALTRTGLSPTSLVHFYLYQHALHPSLKTEYASTGVMPGDGPLEIGSKSTGLCLPSVDARQDMEDSPDSETESCSWISSSDESAATTKGSFETRKEQIIGRVIMAVTEWLRLRFLQAHAKAAQTTANPSEGVSGPSGISSQLSQSQSQPDRKRKRSEDESENGDGDGDKTKRPNPKADNDKGKGKEGLRFACPYFKHNPMKYQRWGTCLGPGWEEVRRVKDHVYRRHRQPKFICLRCGERFESELDHDEHARARIACEVGERQPMEGINAEQEAKLKSRKRDKTLSEVDKWKAVFRILFPLVPADKIPSPFYEQGPHEALTECEEYILREIPQRLQAILMPEFDRDLQIVEQSLRTRAIESTRIIIANLFQEYRNQHPHGTAPNTAPGANSSQQSHTDSISPQPQLSSQFSLDPNGFALNFDVDMVDFMEFGTSAPFENVQRGEIPEAPIDPANSAPKWSESGYGSMNPGPPGDQIIN